MKATNREWKARGEEKPYEPYVFSNASANIRRLYQRLERVKIEAQRPESAPIEGTGGGVSYTVEESKEDNRIYFRFPDGKPKPAILEIMKRGGWRWKRTERAWSRMLNNAGRYAAEWAVKDIQKVTI